MSDPVRRQIKQLFSWAEEHDTEHEAGEPYLTARNGKLALNFSDLSVQSEMYIDRPDELCIAYTRAMMSFLLFKPLPERIAMIGLGGGSIAKYCYRYLPESQIRVIEINAKVLALRDEFAIPRDDERFAVLLADGAAWVTETQWRPDVLILDGFAADGLPAPLCSRKFYDDCYAALDDEGILAVNLWGGYPHFDEYLARINNSFDGTVVCVESTDSLNVIVLAVKNSAVAPDFALIRQHARDLCKTHPLDFQAKSTRLIKALR
jgi:spermidine synthase